MNRSNNAGNSEFDYFSTNVIARNQSLDGLNVWRCLKKQYIGLRSINSIK